MGKVLLSILLLAGAAAPAWSSVSEKDVNLPAANKGLRLGAVDIPMPKGCDAANLRAHVRNHQFRVAGVCGALPKVWQEADEEAGRVVSLNTSGALEILPDPDDNCQSAKRAATYQSGIDGLKMVDKRAHSEGGRIQALCNKDVEAFKKAMAQLRQICGNVPSTEGALAEAPTVEQEAQQLRAEGSRAQKGYEKRIKAHIAGLELDKKVALRCKKSAHSLPLPGDSSSVSTAISKMTVTSTTRVTNDGPVSVPVKRTVSQPKMETAVSPMTVTETNTVHRAK